MTILYSRDHQWIDTEHPDAATVGITRHAQDTLGDVVFIDFPVLGARIEQGKVAGVVESVKAAADVYMPVGGEIVAQNDALVGDPGLVNTDPLGQGWFFKVRVTDTGEFDKLLSQAAYDSFVAAG